MVCIDFIIIIMVMHNLISFLEMQTGQTSTVPTIKVIKHPDSQLKYYGKAVTFTVSAMCTGTGRLYYQWKKDGNVIDDSNDNLPLNFKGAQSPNLFIQSYTPEYDGSYSCTISNEFDKVETKSAELGGLINSINH